MALKTESVGVALAGLGAVGLLAAVAVVNGEPSPAQTKAYAHLLRAQPADGPIDAARAATGDAAAYYATALTALPADDADRAETFGQLPGDF